MQLPMPQMIAQALCLESVWNGDPLTALRLSLKTCQYALLSSEDEDLFPAPTAGRQKRTS